MLFHNGKVGCLGLSQICTKFKRWQMLIAKLCFSTYTVNISAKKISISVRYRPWETNFSRDLETQTKMEKFCLLPSTFILGCRYEIFTIPFKKFIWYLLDSRYKIAHDSQHIVSRILPRKISDGQLRFSIWDIHEFTGRKVAKIMDISHGFYISLKKSCRTQLWYFDRVNLKLSL